MKIVNNTLSLLLVALIVASCSQKKENSKNTSSADEQTTSSQTETKTMDIASIQEKLCQDFPKDLVLKYNPDGKKIVIEPIDNGSGGILRCKVKLFYGEKNHEFWEGQVTAYINNMKDPFWQYNPERNSALYNKVDNLGEKAVYITNMHQLQILKEGIMYCIVPPNRGRTTNTGKENKEIAIEIAQHFKL